MRARERIALELAPYEEAIASNQGKQDEDAQLQVAWALNSKGWVLNEHGLVADALAVFNAVIEAQDDTTAPRLRQQLAFALLWKGAALRSLRRNDEAVVAYGRVVSDFSDGESEQIDEYLGIARERLRKLTRGRGWIWLQRGAYGLIALGVGMMAIGALLGGDPTNTWWLDLIAAGLAVGLLGGFAWILGEGPSRETALWAGAFLLILASLATLTLVPVPGWVRKTLIGLWLLAVAVGWFGGTVKRLVRRLTRGPETGGTGSPSATRRDQIGNAVFVGGGGLLLVGLFVSQFVSFRHDLLIHGYLVSMVGALLLQSSRDRGSVFFRVVVAVSAAAFLLLPASSWINDAAFIVLLGSCGLWIGRRKLRSFVMAHRRHDRAA